MRGGSSCTVPTAGTTPNEIRYLQVSPPDRLVSEHVVEPPFRHEVTFAAAGRETEVTVRMVFASAEAHDRAVREFGALEGLGQTLTRLGGYGAA